MKRVMGPNEARFEKNRKESDAFFWGWMDLFRKMGHGKRVEFYLARRKRMFARHRKRVIRLDLEAKRRAAEVSVSPMASRASSGISAHASRYKRRRST
jgi:hypothetical protein